MWPFNRKPAEETRSVSGTGYTAMVLQGRESYISGTQGVGELTATVQTCVSLWEHGLSLADVEGTDVLTRHMMAVIGRSLALRGEAVLFLGEMGLIPCVDWDLKTRDSRPVAYRISTPETGGAQSRTVLAAEVLHFRIGSDTGAPYLGTAPLRRARLTAGMLQAVETALSEVYDVAPLGSQIVPLPEMDEATSEKMARGFRGRRGQVLTRESVNVQAAGGAAPVTDWQPRSLTPDLQSAMPRDMLEASRNALALVYGVLPGLLNPATTGPMVREAQRHLAQFMLQPVAAVMAEECTTKLGGPVSIDCVRPLQAFDAGGRARAFGAMVQAMAMAKEAGLDPQAVEDSLKFIDWE